MPSKPMLIYDGYCNLCSWLVRFAQRFDKKERIALQPSQNSDGMFDVGIPEKVFKSTVVFVSPQGKVYVKSRAALRILKTLGGIWSIAWFFLLLIPNPIRNFFITLFQGTDISGLAKGKPVIIQFPKHKHLKNSFYETITVSICVTFYFTNG